MTFQKNPYPGTSRISCTTRNSTSQNAQIPSPRGLDGVAIDIAATPVGETTLRSGWIGADGRRMAFCNCSVPWFAECLG